MTILKQSSEGVTRENMKGGSGKATFYYVPIPDDDGAITMASRIELEPSASIGFHEHSDDEEVYAIVSGKGVFTDGTTETEVNPGDIPVSYTHLDVYKRQRRSRLGRRGQ